ncbi:large ribosomal subunit protein bL9m [Neocloeon triangulifer]|uniref:large ribosomal subunit protein bL9m n=1 Tax=Neocloeon triangulifer TaxID=2078957 RepID=UPI00286ED668|nr:large ribosomal subunit protein bL9m [Neocloeon triangulifer]
MLKLCSRLSTLSTGMVHPPGLQFAFISSSPLERCSTILKRKFPLRPHKKGHRPVKLKGTNYVYETVQGRNKTKEEPLEVILTQYVDGVGKKGDKVKLRRNFVYNRLLLPKLAVYVNPENEALFCSEASGGASVEFSSKDAPRTVAYIARQMVAVTMSKDNPWTLEPWHIRANARKAGIIISDDSCIEMPPGPISGPDLSLQNKEFFVTITLNKKEKVNLRCRIHHWSSEPSERIYAHYPWFEKAEPIFAEQAEYLEQVPLPKFRVLNISAPEYN